MFSPLEKGRYSDQISQRILGKILANEVETGHRFPSEKDLAEEFHVSRSVIREALRQLESLGVVEIRKGPIGGIFASNVYHRPIRDSLLNLLTSGVATVDHIFSVRLLIEPHMAGQAARLALEEDFRPMRNLLIESRLCGEDPARIKKNAFAFHSCLGKASKNPVFSILLDSVLELLEKVAAGFVVPAFELELLEAHEKILEALTDRNAELAQRLVEEDILRIRDTLRPFAEAKLPK